MARTRHNPSTCSLRGFSMAYSSLPLLVSSSVMTACQEQQGRTGQQYPNAYHGSGSGIGEAGVQHIAAISLGISHLPRDIGSLIPGAIRYAKPKVARGGAFVATSGVGGARMRPATTIDSTPRTFAVVSTFDHPTDQRHGIQDRQPRSRGRLVGLHRALALGIALVNAPQWPLRRPDAITRRRLRCPRCSTHWRETRFVDQQIWSSGRNGRPRRRRERSVCWEVQNHRPQEMCCR
jgi:hypothetical protein